MILNKLISLLKPQKDGSLPISRFFRQVFESPSIKLALGFNLAVAGLAIGSLTSPKPVLSNQETVVIKAEENIIHTEASLQQPLTGYLSQGYHWYHPAIDIAGPLNRPIYPIAQGRVKEVSYSSWGYGHKVVIEHQQGLRSLYAHLGEIKVEPGQEVNKETVIGTVGLTGWTTGSHLHLEIWRGKKALNPQTVLADFPKKLLAEDKKDN